ncbi:hypothetical protein JTB14_018312 [Gonioctena quinquepunctata]|nr:hypothetical protein JTB14_018312 [Gonioctena quinquepunctata]
MAKKNDEDVAELLTYELTPFHPAVFSEGSMRKGKKFLQWRTTQLSISPKASCGRRWFPFPPHELEKFPLHLLILPSVHCVCTDTLRAEAKNAHKYFNESTIITIQQKHFFANERNKTRLIHLLAEKMTAAGIEITATTRHADGTIEGCGFKRAALHSTVAIFGEDLYLIVLLIGLAPLSINMYTMRPGRGKVKTKLFSLRKLQHFPFSKTTLLLQSFSGCITISAIYGESEVRIAKNGLTHAFTATVADPSISPEDIQHVGEKLFLAVY